MPYGVTREMIDAWGQVVFDLSLNRQIRTGDPIRKLDHVAWAAQRDATGLSDDEIAARVGLARPQVTFIRNLLERRIFRTNQYRKLYRLGGGRRWREDEYVDPEEAYAVGPEAALLRQALAFDRAQVAAWVRSGAWTPETGWDRIAAAARDRAEAPALAADGAKLTWDELAGAGDAMARGLMAHGIGRGEAVALALPPGPLAAMALAAVWRLGGAVLFLPNGLSGPALTDLLHRARARAVLFGPGGVDGDAEAFGRAAAMLPSLTLLATPAGGGGTVSLGDLAKGGPRRPVPPVAGDPAVLVASRPVDADVGGGAAALVPHTHHTFLASARALAATASAAVGAMPTALLWRGEWADPGFAAVLGLWIATGATLTTDEKDAPEDAWRAEPVEPASAGASGLRLHGAAGAGLEVLTSAESQGLLVRQSDGPWRAMPGVALRTTEEGRLEARGPAMAPAYVDDPAATAARFLPGGWVRSRLAAAIDGDAVTLAEAAASAA